jgi:hypothetical protein
MATTDLMIGIGAEYKGKAAFGKANKDVLGLTAGIKSLAKAYIGLAGAQKAFRYATQSIKAFAEDDAAIQKLSRTLDNLGFAYEQTNVEEFIGGLERTYHVADDLLRPAFSKLVQVTQSYTKSKQLLTAALNASAGAGVDLSTTVSDLSQAYVGNLKGLKKYNLGLTNAELSTMTFEQILSKLNSTFSGQASLAADTYAGKLNALAIASGNAKEIIGKGLVDAIGTAFGNGDIERATKNIEAMAASVADMVRGLGDVARLSGFNLLANVFGALRNKRNELATKDRVYDPRSGNMPDMSPAAMKIIQARKKADADAAKRQKELAALAQKQTKAIKEQTALQKAKAVIDKASAVMNMDLIQNTAALMGKVTEDETLRLKLQQAILLGNADAASKLSQELLTTQINAIILANIDPFGSFTSGAAAALKAMIELRNEMGTLTTPVLTRGEQLLAEDFLAAIQDQNDKSFDEAFEETKNFLDSLRNQPIGNMDLNYQDAFSRPNAGSGFTPTELRIFIDPTAAQYGIGVASVNNSANGNNNNYSTIQSFAGGM